MEEEPAEYVEDPDSEIQRLYHENNAIKKNLRDLSEQLTQEIDKVRNGKKSTPPKFAQNGATSYKANLFNQAAYE